MYCSVQALQNSRAQLMNAMRLDEGEREECKNGILLQIRANNMCHTILEPSQYVKAT